MDKSFLGQLENIMFHLDPLTEGTLVEEFMDKNIDYAVMAKQNVDKSLALENLMGVVCRSDIQKFHNLGIKTIDQNCVEPFKTMPADTPPLELFEIFKNEKIKWIAITENENVIGFVSEHHLLESIYNAFEGEQLKLNQLQQKLHDKDDYIAILAHDIRSPISVISICCDYLNYTVGQETELDQDIKDFISRIKSNAGKAQSLVETILDIEALEQGSDTKSRVQIESVFMPDFMNPLINDLKYISGQKKIELIGSCDEKFYANIDKTRFTQIIENLINNAIKFSPKESSIYVSTKMISKDKKNWLELAIRDEGAGIPKEKLETVFAKYQQLDNDEIVKESGVGLGLSIVQQYTNLHNGEVGVESVEGKGATFTVRIPGASQEAMSTDVLETDSKKVLVVEDDEDIQYFTEMALKDAGYEVITANDGSEGINMLRISPYDVVVSDIRMPKKDGIEFMQEAKTMFPDLPFIIISGFYPSMDNEIIQDVFSAAKMVRKPFSKEVIVKTVAEVLETQKTKKAA